MEYRYSRFNRILWEWIGERENWCVLGAYWYLLCCDCTSRTVLVHGDGSSPVAKRQFSLTSEREGKGRVA